LNLRASFPRWRCFIPVNAAVLRLPSFSLASTKNTLRIFQSFKIQIGKDEKEQRDDGVFFLARKRSRKGAITAVVIV
jgi:hypothetical protein